MNSIHYIPAEDTIIAANANNVSRRFTRVFSAISTEKMLPPLSTFKGSTTYILSLQYIEYLRCYILQQLSSLAVHNTAEDNNANRTIIKCIKYFTNFDCASSYNCLYSLDGFHKNFSTAVKMLPDNGTTPDCIRELAAEKVEFMPGDNLDIYFDLDSYSELLVEHYARFDILQGSDQNNCFKQ